MKLSNKEIKLILDLLDRLTMDAIDKCYYVDDASFEAHQRYGSKIGREEEAYKMYENLHLLAQKLKRVNDE